MVTKSFTVEGRVRMAQADADLLAPREPVHTLIVMPNRRLLQMGDTRILFRDSLQVADAICRPAVQSMADLMTMQGWFH